MTRFDPTPPDVRAGERIAGGSGDTGGPGSGGHAGRDAWETLGFRRTHEEPGRVTLEWEAGPEWTSRTSAGTAVQGGLVTALLDAAMGSACSTVLDADQGLLTADLRAEFLRPTPPGHLHCTGQVVRRTSSVVFCSADLYDAAGTHLAAARCTQVVVAAGPAAS